MDGINALIDGFGTALTPVNLLYAVIAVALSIGSFYLFALGLGIVLPPGILRGIL